MFFTNGFLVANLLPRYPEVKQAFDLSNTEFGVVVAMMALGSMVASWLPAPLIRRFGAGPVAFFGTVGIAAAVTTIGFAPHVFLVAAAMAVSGFSDAVTDTAQNVHGRDGMGDIGLELSGRRPADGHAVDALLAASHAHAGELTLVTLGPLTNVAHAIERDPSLPERIPRTVVMGAVADHIGNVTPVAEYNMWADPHAVDVVLASGLTLEFVGWDISRHYAVVEPELAADLRSIGTPLAEFAVDIQRAVSEFCETETKLAGFDLPDPIAMAVAIDPSVATTTRRLHLAVETESALTRGMVVMDVLGLTDLAPNALVVTAADTAKFLRMLRATLV